MHCVLTFQNWLILSHSSIQELVHVKLCLRVSISCWLQLLLSKLSKRLICVVSSFPSFSSSSCALSLLASSLVSVHGTYQQHRLSVAPPQKESLMPAGSPNEECAGKYRFTSLCKHLILSGSTRTTCDSLGRNAFSNSRVTVLASMQDQPVMSANGVGKDQTVSIVSSSNVSISRNTLH